MVQNPANILSAHKIRHTSAREEILDLFCEAEAALSQPDIEKKVGKEMDRVTIYRTLSVFLEKGILHKVLDDMGAMKYALCSDACEPHDHSHDHVHFKCSECGRTQCIENLEIPHLTLPSGFQLEEANLLLQGVCPDCGSK